MLAKALQQASGGVEKLYVDDVFSTWLYNGNGSTQTITNGIDLAGKGGMVWLKQRSGTGDHYIFDTLRYDSGAGSYSRLNTASTAAETAATGAGLTAFQPNGFTLTGSGTAFNSSSNIYASWAFRNAPKFFTHTTVSHTNGSATNISLSSLGTVGMVVAKITNTTGDWITWHRSLTAGNNLRLNTTAAQTTTNAWLSVSGTTATLSSSAPTGTYVIYAWAHDASAEGMIQCGTYTNNSGAVVNINLGWEPQLLLVRPPSVVSDWLLMDSTRGYSSAADWCLLPNTTSAEQNTTNFFNPTATGFTTSAGGTSTNIYLAIRMPNKPPTSGTEVFQPVVYTGTNVDNRLVDTGIKTDMVWLRERNDTTPTGFVVGDRLRGQPYLWTGATSAELSDADSLDQQIVSTTEYGTAFSSMTGVWVGNDLTAKVNSDTTADNHIALAFQRRPGFFDIVCYTGTGVARTVPHQLGVAPELMIFKRRDNATGWPVYVKPIGVNSLLELQQNTATNSANAYFNATPPTAENFSIGTASPVNFSGSSFVAYLFASLPGISKVGSYTGNGTTAGDSQAIDCGFTTGARFVLIKKTSNTSNWCLFDTARGINAASNDPFLTTNLASAESTSTNSIDPSASGFSVVYSAAGLNDSGQTYIYLAIA